MSATTPIVTETARQAANASELHETIEFLTFTVVILAAILIIDVAIEIYRIYERPPQEPSLKPQRYTSDYWRR